jgi:hypothetical protein
MHDVETKLGLLGLIFRAYLQNPNRAALPDAARLTTMHSFEQAGVRLENRIQNARSGFVMGSSIAKHIQNDEMEISRNWLN